jgi:hypothetical protein
MECIVCAYEIDCVERYPALGACGHNGLCSLCSLRIRALQRNLACVSCKRELEYVICSGKPDAKFEDFPMWGDSIGPEYVLDQKSQMFFPTEYYKNKVQKLWVYKCTVCSHVFRDVKALRHHVSSEHNMQICLHCVENKHDFPAEQRIYTQKQYETHLREGDQDGSQGHPNCEFCKKRYYDSTALFMHLNKDHYTCHLCEKIGIKFKYYKDYKHLEDHFRGAHLLCDDPACLARKFVVFDNEIDMEVHNRKYHPTFTMKRPTTIKLDFKVARPSAGGSRGGGDESGLKGDGYNAGDEEHPATERERHVRYEGGLGGRERNGEWQVELQPLSADPRDVNRNAHLSSAAPVMPAPESETFVEDFPSLQASSGGGAAGPSGPITITNKWVSLATASGKKGKKNDFPALQKPGGSAGGRHGGAKVKSNSTLSDIQKDYYGMSSDSTVSSLTTSASPRPAVGTLGDWARIKEIRKPISGTKNGGGSGNGVAGGRAAAKDHTQTMYENVLGAAYEDSLAIALAESLSDAYKAGASGSTKSGAPKHSASEGSLVPPPPVPTPALTSGSSGSSGKDDFFPPGVPASIAYSRTDATNVEAYPTLAATAPASAPATKPPKKKQQGKSTASGGWSEALSAMGMAGAAGTGKTAKNKLTVIKASGSNASFSRFSEEGNSAKTSNSAPPLSGEKAGASGLSWDNLKPMGKKSVGFSEDEWRAGGGGLGAAATDFARSSSSFGATTGSSSSSLSGSDKKYGGWALKIGGSGKEHGGATEPVMSGVPTPYRSLAEYPSLAGAGSK